jgi:D-alanyl-D-alanine carboxypeptidase
VPWSKALCGRERRQRPIIQARLTTPNPAPQRRGKRTRVDGAFQVQVGAYMSQTEAENRLGMVQQRATDLLDGHLPFTASFMKEDREWFRARFAGFSEEEARETCVALKKRSLDCVVMRAE